MSWAGGENAHVVGPDERVGRTATSGFRTVCVPPDFTRYVGEMGANWKSLMIRRLLGPLISIEPATFDVPGSAEMGARLLREVVYAPFSQPFTRESLIGQVSESQVTVWRYRPFIRQGFARAFYGRFHDRTDGTVLTGHFAMKQQDKILSIAWFCFVLLFIPAAIATGSAGVDISLYFIPLAMLLLGLGLVHFSWWLSRGDIDYIGHRIREALQPGEKRQDAALPIR